ncbi:MAG: NrfD/PsrC family molybdoenzyme membrane anchor subunit, partial [Planctomycetota bacterium]
MSTIVVDNTFDDPARRAPLVLNHTEFSSVTEKICSVNEARVAPRAWYITFAISVVFLVILGLMVTYLFITGIGVWGNQSPVAWGFPIINFVFWVGIGHAGTLISAILHLFRQKWRTSINRFAEAMTIFAVVCAGMFPGIHIGRVWLFYWLFPIPNQMEMWPQFR